ncbi:MAG: hypothetical protein J6Y94_07475, partial [Bacteriovoracaceae bacterium]|nr:hypothetical protein [Bacteriovoracaceae bacterium]
MKITRKLFLNSIFCALLIGVTRGAPAETDPAPMPAIADVVADFVLPTADLMKTSDGFFEENDGRLYLMQAYHVKSVNNDQLYYRDLDTLLVKFYAQHDDSLELRTFDLYADKDVWANTGAIQPLTLGTLHYAPYPVAPEKGTPDQYKKVTSISSSLFSAIQLYSFGAKAFKEGKYISFYNED